MNCCKLSCCILMAWLTRVSVQHRPGHGEGCITCILFCKPELYKINVDQMWGDYCLSVKLATADDAAFVLLLCQLCDEGWYLIRPKAWQYRAHQLSCLQATGTSRMSSYRIITLQPTATPNILWRQQCVQWGAHSCLWAGVPQGTNALPVVFHASSAIKRTT